MNSSGLFKELFNMLQKDKYFPSVSDKNAVWVLTTERFERVFSYFTKTNKVSMGLCEEYLRNRCTSSCEMHFKYYSNPKNGKKKFMKCIMEIDINVSDMDG